MAISRKLLSMKRIALIFLCAALSTISLSVSAQQCRNSANHDKDRVVFCNDGDSIRYVKKIWPSGESNFRVRPGDFVIEHITSNGGVCFQWASNDGQFSPDSIAFARKGRLVNLRFPVADGSCSANGTPRSASHKSLQSLADLYPSVPLGSKKHFILIPSEKDESNRQIEIMVGKIVKGDECNNVWFIATTSTKFAKVADGSWPYLTIEGATLHSTIAGCYRDNEVEKLALVFGIPRLEYNSEIPLVVYAPVGFNVQYRVWLRSEPIEIPERKASSPQ
ncbi:MAG: hypothetical protein JNL16_12985 [Dechloromonas sp.]|nr:hypothetical protein [Dechloromonas sp.]